MAYTIMLVDDSPTILSLLRLTLQQAGYSVLTAGDGVEALELLKSAGADLIITDVNMPRMDGITFIKRLKFQENTRDIPLIILSSQQGERDHKIGRVAGADLYLDKPVTPSELLGGIRQLLA